MKTIIFFRKRARTPKMQGLATAAGSASVIRELRRSAKAGKGRVYLVDAPAAEHGRGHIAAFPPPSSGDSGGIENPHEDSEWNACPCCGERMVIIEIFEPGCQPWQWPIPSIGLDSS